MLGAINYIDNIIYYIIKQSFTIQSFLGMEET